MTNIKLSILIPVRNEGVDIKIMLKILQAVIEIPYEILVVYDFPEDDTVSVIQSHAAQFSQVRLIHNMLGAGVVNAVRAGVRQAQGEYILIFAADEVGPVLAINDMVSLLDNGCDFVSCTRYAHGGRRLGGSFIGGILSRLANKLFSFISSCAFSDATTGIKMFRRDVFERINLESRPIGWAFVFELAIKAQLAGMRLGEVPVISIDRLYGGKSSFALRPWVKEYLRWFLWGLRKLPGAKKTSVAIKIPQATL
jgi:dolichol-phosphate mannosyltransferase